MSDMPTPGPAGWYADPSGRHAQRFWNGAVWTELVSDGSAQGSEPPPRPGPAPVTGVSRPDEVRRQVREQAGITEPVPGGSGHLLDEPVLVVNQKPKRFEMTYEYAVFDQHGHQLGSVVQVGQGAFRKVLRFFEAFNDSLPRRFEVRDQNGAVVLLLARPLTLYRSTIVVSRPDGAEIGRIRQENVVGKLRFAFETGGLRFGGMTAKSRWRPRHFQILDAHDHEVAWIKKTWEGLFKRLFTTADNYVVRLHRRLDDPLRALVIAAALAVDNAFVQDSSPG